ncbi:MAG: helix-turn-helix transcriptional regulator [Dehalococcoidia bacterium]
MPEWTFLTNHGLVLSYMARHPRITARDLADAVGITERATRKIIADLLEAGYITKKREGRRNRYRVNPDLSLRHPIHSEAAIGDLLQALGWKRRKRTAQPS